MRFRATSGIFEAGRRCEPSGDWETRPWRIPGPGGGDVVERLLPQDETRTRAVRQARRLVCPVAVRYLGSSGAVAPVHPSTHPR